jgi:predicted transcriptional regulator
MEMGSLAPYEEIFRELLGNPKRNETKRRDKFYIMAYILQTAKDGALKTQIMYRNNLSFT